MKKIIIPSLMVCAMIVSCGSPSTEKADNTANANQQADKDLLTKAKGIFQPLPERADNPENPITEAKVKLGKMLYYDTRLSKTGNNSCNSCHNLATYGVDNAATSKGDAGKNGERNSPTVFNAAFNVAQFWDGRAKDVEEQAGGPILNPVEMAIPSKEYLEKKLRDAKDYDEMFKAVFPDDKQPITYTNITKSIAAFERTLVTPAPFDAYLKGDATALNDDQKLGLRMFIETGCTQCHMGSGVGGTLFQKFGLFADYRTLTNSTTNDEGKKKQSNQAGDKDVFKASSLRNIAKTAPYFHDGSVSDLNKAVVIMGKTQLNKELSDAEVGPIVAFLNSLTGTVAEDVKTPPATLTKK